MSVQGPWLQREKGEPPTQRSKERMENSDRQRQGEEIVKKAEYAQRKAMEKVLKGSPSTPPPAPHPLPTPRPFP